MSTCCRCRGDITRSRTDVILYYECPPPNPTPPSLPLTECLKALGRMELAAQSYTKVVEMAPQHLEARLSLATLQQQLGRPDCALKALESMYDSETLAQDSSAAQKARRQASALSICMSMTPRIVQNA